MINVLFFAQLKELLACEAIQVSMDNIDPTVAGLRAHLAEKGELWADYLSTDKSLCAVNQTLCDDTQPIGDNDEVAFFPPVTGG